MAADDSVQLDSPSRAHESPRTAEAQTAAVKAALGRGLDVTRAEVLQDSNRVVLRLRPCDVVLRVHQGADKADSLATELSIASQLGSAGAPVGTPLDRVPPEVVREGDFVMTFWTYYEPTGPRKLDPSEYARALVALHSALKTVEVVVPHFTARVAEAQRRLAEEELTRMLRDDDRELLVGALTTLRARFETCGVPEQLLHGEPHSDNVLRTASGLLFTDLEACCVGPVVFDVADTWPDEVAGFYPGIDPVLLRQARALVAAMVAVWCWSGYEDHPNLRSAAPECTADVRRMVAAGVLA